MRLLIVGGLQGQIGLATKIAMDKGAKVTHANDIEQALSSLRGGVGADLVFCDVTLDIGSVRRIGVPGLDGQALRCDDLRSQDDDRDIHRARVGD